MGCQKIAGVQSKVLVWDNYQNETGVIGRVPMDRVNLAVGQPSVGLKIAGSSERFVSRRGFFFRSDRKTTETGFSCGPEASQKQSPKAKEFISLGRKSQVKPNRKRVAKATAPPDAAVCQRA